jgi:VWFA-related protein
MARAIALLMVVMLAYGQTPSPQSFQAQDPGQPEVVIRISVNLVQVDAVVYDAKGKYVTDLKSEDFEILQDGKPQQITNFAYISTRSAGTRIERVAVVDKTAPPPPPIRLKPTQVRRTFALVVDDLGLSFESIARVRSSLKKFVDEQVQPGDMVAIVRTGAGMGALQNFSTDKRMLYAAIDRVKYNAYGRVGVSSFGPINDTSEGEGGGGDADTRNEEFRETWFSVGTLGAISYVVSGLRELPGRKSIILFTENMRMFNTEGMNDRVMDNMRRLTDAANRASVVIYTIDPRGLPTLSFTAADKVDARNPQRMAQQQQQRSQQYWDSQEGMNFLSQETGGTFFHDNNDINAGVRKVLEDQEGYYLIGYHPAAATFDEKTGQPKFHKVSVKVKRPGLHVRTRNGFYGTSDQDRMPVPRGRDEQLAHALVSPFGASGIPLRLTALFSNAPKRGSWVTSLLHIDTSALSFVEDTEPTAPPTFPPGTDPAKVKAAIKAAADADAKMGPWKKTVMDILVSTFGDNGQEVDRSNRTYTIRMRGDTLKQALTQGMIYTVTHPIKKPGAYQMRVAVRDATSERVGSASQYVEVPDVSKGHLVLSGLVLKGFVPQQKPTGSAVKEGKMEDPDPRGSPAMRIFQPGKALTYGYEIMNAKAEGNQVALESTMRLFRDGKQIFAGKPVPIDPAGQPDLKHLINGGRLQLGTKMEPGEYTLQVSVHDNHVSDKYKVASQYMNFEIQK